MRHRAGVPSFAWTLLAACLALWACGAVLAVVSGQSSLVGVAGAGWLVVLFSLVFLAFGTVGALVAARRPTHPVGWLLLAAALTEGTRFAALVYVASEPVLRPALPPAPGLVPWVGALGATLTFSILPLAALFFPDGRLPSRAWRPYLWAMVAMSAIAVLATAFRGNPPGLPAGSMDPVAMPGATGAVLAELVLVLRQALLLLALPAALSLLLRLRHARERERQQISWVILSITFGALGAAVFWGAGGWVWAGAAGPAGALAATFYMLGLGAIPVAVGIAILRYRLYDIDVLIRRTVTYGVLSAVLVATYAAVIVLSQGALRPITGGSELAVAVSTLVIVTLAQPLRRRIQDAVDRRFYRSRYDAARTLDAFTARLRSEVDLGSVRADLLDVVGATMRPLHASLWLRAGGR